MPPNDGTAPPSPPRPPVRIQFLRMLEPPPGDPTMRHHTMQVAWHIIPPELSLPHDVLPQQLPLFSKQQIGEEHRQNTCFLNRKALWPSVSGLAGASGLQIWDSAPTKRFLPRTEGIILPEKVRPTPFHTHSGPCAHTNWFVFLA